MSAPILNVDELCEHKEYHSPDNHPLVPQHIDSQTFRWLISGRSGCGKTNVVVSCLLSNQIKFDKLYLFVRNPNQIKYKLLLQWIKTMERHIAKVTGNKAFSLVEIVSDPTQIPTCDNLNKKLINLVIFDDLLNVKNQDVIIDYFTQGRHMNINCVYLTQDYHGTEIRLRKNCNYFSVFGVSSKSELVQLAKEHSLMHDFKDFKNILNKATVKRNDFLFIDRQTENPLLQLRQNFDHIWNPDLNKFESIQEALLHVRTIL